MKKLLLVGLLLFGTSQLFSQDSGTVRGTITDLEMHNEPLFFADVALKDSPVKVQTNFHGNFEITGVASGEHILVISYLGYESVELPVLVEAGESTFIQTEMRAKSIDFQDTLPADLPVAANNGFSTASDANFE